MAAVALPALLTEALHALEPAWAALSAKMVDRATGDDYTVDDVARLGPKSGGYFRAGRGPWLTCVDHVRLVDPKGSNGPPCSVSEGIEAARLIAQGSWLGVAGVLDEPPLLKPKEAIPLGP
eukprot:CAMPEP_0179117292 /NCGR_PEP_ID=MMETSP0796-20121207/55080_1 /TAXON_ID=73915 /ORGANISM="Pyrodinium bahamense, Strain pbaha01" /LENGTH=120 /DNA_ID=CAMNT_0020815649 /DNA_START=568 /DNA_END=928 /DNA_ORIENTATION=-